MNNLNPLNVPQGICIILTTPENRVALLPQGQKYGFNGGYPDLERWGTAMESGNIHLPMQEIFSNTLDGLSLDLKQIDWDTPVAEFSGPIIRREKEIQTTEIKVYAYEMSADEYDDLKTLVPDVLCVSLDSEVPLSEFAENISTVGHNFAVFQTAMNLNLEG